MLFLSSWKVHVLIFLFFVLSACSTVPTPLAPPEIIFNVSSDIQANNGGLFYFVVRRSNEKQFMSDVYQDIASKVFTDLKDTDNLGVFSIAPGFNQECLITQPSQGSVSLYFLLTQPNTQWKKLISMPFQEIYDVKIRSDNQIDITDHKSWYSLF
jgi:hypothetical protein